MSSTDAERDAQPIRPGDLAAQAQLDPIRVFRQIFDSLPDVVLEVDGRGRIVFANARVEQVFGYRPDELMNSTVEVLIPPDLRVRHTEDRAAFSERPQTREMGSSVSFAGLRKDGTRFSADVALSPIRLENYPASHTLAFIRDVSHLRRLEIAERQLLDQTLLGLVTMLNSLLSLTAPWIFERTQSIRALVNHMAQGLPAPDLWQYQLSAELCLIGCMAVPPSIYENAWAGAPLEEEETRVFRSHPSIGQKLLSSIPRLEDVAEIVGSQQSPVAPGVGRRQVGVSLLQLAQQVDQLLYRGKPLFSILPQLRRMHPSNRSGMIEALVSYSPPQAPFHVKSLGVNELQPGMILGEDFNTDTGVLVAPKETRISGILLERIRNFARMSGGQKRVLVRWSDTP